MLSAVSFIHAYGCKLVIVHTFYLQMKHTFFDKNRAMFGLNYFPESIYYFLAHRLLSLGCGHTFVFASFGRKIYYFFNLLLPS